MYCQHCGNELPDNSQFCNRCGQSVKVPLQTQEQITLVNEKVTKPLSTQEAKTTFYIGSFFAVAFCVFSLLDINNFYCILGGIASITISIITIKFAKKHNRNYTLMIITLIIAVLCIIVGLCFFCLTVLFSVS